MHILMVAIIGEVGIGVFAVYFFDSGIHTPHKLVDVVEAKRSPSVVLARLNEHIGVLDSGAEHTFLELAPIVFTAVESAHIMHINLSDILLSFPLIAGINQLLSACIITTLQATKDTFGRKFAGFFGRYSGFYQLFFDIYTTSAHFIGICFLRKS